MLPRCRSLYFVFWLYQIPNLIRMLAIERMHISNFRQRNVCLSISHTPEQNLNFDLISHKFLISVQPFTSQAVSGLVVVDCDTHPYQKRGSLGRQWFRFRWARAFFLFRTNSCSRILTSVLAIAPDRERETVLFVCLAVPLLYCTSCLIWHQHEDYNTIHPYFRQITGFELLKECTILHQRFTEIPQRQQKCYVTRLEGEHHVSPQLPPSVRSYKEIVQGGRCGKVRNWVRSAMKKAKKRCFENIGETVEVCFSMNVTVGVITGNVSC